MIILKNFPFYDKPIKRPVKHLKNIDPLLAEQLRVIKKDQAFKGYAISYKVKIVEKKRSNCTIRSK